MKVRGIFAIVAAFVANIGVAFRTPAHASIGGRISNGRQAFYTVSASHRANQRRNYAKGWAKGWAK